MSALPRALHLVDATSEDIVGAYRTGARSSGLCEGLEKNKEIVALSKVRCPRRRHIAAKVAERNRRAQEAARAFCRLRQSVKEVLTAVVREIVTG